MIDKNEQRFFGGQDVASVIQQIQGALYQSGIPLQQTGPNSWAGKGQQSSYALTPSITLTTMPVQNGFSVDARVGADLQTNGIIILIVSWIFFFPLAIILGVLGYQDWQTRQTQLLAAIWAPVQNRMLAPPQPQYGAPQQQYGAPVQQQQAPGQGFGPPEGAPPPQGGPPGGWGGGQQ